jgi:hypothetical protein
VASEAENCGHVARVGVGGDDVQVVERGGREGGEGSAGLDQIVEVREPELRDVRPEVTPAPREDAGARGGRREREAEEDVKQHVVGEVAEEVLILPLSDASFLTAAGNEGLG